MRNLITLLLLTFFYTTSFAQTGCPGCLTNLPNDMVADTLFLGTASDGQVGIAYDEDLSFRLPITTTTVAEVDSTIPPGIGINEIVINGLSNLPPGLSWEVSRDTFVPADLNDGCVKICGTPQQAGLYYVQVGITAQIFVVSQESSFSFPIYIAPEISFTDGFSMENSSGCGSTTVNFQNNIPSNGVDGYSYTWDFGNGVTSLDENPAPQTYTEVGNHEVNYEVVIDTSGHFLNTIIVENVACSDIFGSIDMFAKITDPDGTVIFISEPIPETDPPVTFELDLPIGAGNYTLEIIDEDSGINGNDDNCGTISFNQLSSGPLVAGDLEVILMLTNPVTIIQAVDTVTVYAVPDAPEVTINVETTFCAGDTTILSASYFDGIQWYQDTLPLVGENEPVLIVTSSGNYSVVYQDENGCMASSEVLQITVFENPEAAELENTDNLLTANNLMISDPVFALQWYFEGEAITDENSDIYCAEESGIYGFEIINLTTGCIAYSEIEVVYDEGFVNCVSDTDDIFEQTMQLQLYPNPVTTTLNVQLNIVEKATIELRLIDVLGRTRYRFLEKVSVGNFKQAIETSHLEGGLYFFEIGMGDFKTIKTLVVE